MDELKQHNFAIEIIHKIEADSAIKIAQNIRAKTSFKDMFDLYCQHRTSGQVFDLTQQ